MCLTPTPPSLQIKSPSLLPAPTPICTNAHDAAQARYFNITHLHSIAHLHSITHSHTITHLNTITYLLTYLFTYLQHVI